MDPVKPVGPVGPVCPVGPEGPGGPSDPVDVDILFLNNLKEILPSHHINLRDQWILLNQLVP